MSLRETCVSCFNERTIGSLTYGDQILRVMPCGHVFCKSCIAQHCSISLSNRSLIPVHCCGLEYPTEYIMEALGHTNFNTYSQFLSERQWINSDLRSDIEYAATVKQAGGMQCPRCGVGVIKLSGCNHMVCFCGFRFNYWN